MGVFAVCFFFFSNNKAALPTLRTGHGYLELALALAFVSNKVMHFFQVNSLLPASVSMMEVISVYLLSPYLALKV